MDTAQFPDGKISRCLVIPQVQRQKEVCSWWGFWHTFDFSYFSHCIFLHIRYTCMSRTTIWIFIKIEFYSKIFYSIRSKEKVIIYNTTTRLHQTLFKAWEKKSVVSFPINFLLQKPLTWPGPSVPALMVMAGLVLPGSALLAVKGSLWLLLQRDQSRFAATIY